MTRRIVIRMGFLIVVLGFVLLSHADNPLVLVELFTSEGCSSCPPADRILAALQKTQPFPGVTVVPLAFHVDYWDNLGWKDPFGDKNNSLRQQLYARIREDERVYTPQMVVNGQYSFVGSDRKKLRAAVQDKSKGPGSTLKIQVLDEDKGLKLTIKSDLKPPSGTVLWIAVAEDDLVSKITRGENKGKTLVHQGVVRSMARYPADSAAEAHPLYRVTVPWTDTWKRKNCRIVVALQSEKTGAVLALGQLALGASE